VALLARTSAMLNSLLRGMPDSWITANEGGDTWSPVHIVGHLIHGERTDWIPRAKIILEHGEKRTFVRFDRLAQFARGTDLVHEVRHPVPFHVACRVRRSG